MARSRTKGSIAPEDVELPEFLRDLPRFDFTHAPPTTREQWGQADVIYGAKSVVDAIERAGKRVRSAVPDQPKRAK